MHRKKCAWFLFRMGSREHPPGSRGMRAVAAFFAACFLMASPCGITASAAEAPHVEAYDEAARDTGSAEDAGTGTEGTEDMDGFQEDLGPRDSGSSEAEPMDPQDPNAGGTQEGGDPFDGPVYEGPVGGEAIQVYLGGYIEGTENGDYRTVALVGNDMDQDAVIAFTDLKAADENGASLDVTFEGIETVEGKGGMGEGYFVTSGIPATVAGKVTASVNGVEKLSKEFSFNPQVRMTIGVPMSPDSADADVEAGTWEDLAPEGEDVSTATLDPSVPADPESESESGTFRVSVMIGIVAILLTGGGFLFLLYKKRQEAYLEARYGGGKDEE